jgi:AdoMet-dependent heme synthase
MSLDLARKIIVFGRQGNSPRITISGGEPLLHPNLKEIIEFWLQMGGRDTVITTNGLLITEEWASYFKNLTNFRIQVSLDSLDPLAHDAFRGHKGAYSQAVKAVRILKKANVSVSIRCTINPSNISIMEEMVKFGIAESIDRFAIGFVVADGRALKNKLYHTKSSKKEALEELKRLRLLYSDKIAIENTDPLQCHMGFINLEGIDPFDKLLFGGCNAGISGFYCSSHGLITPCSFLPVEILNANNYDLSYMMEKYENSLVMKNLIKREYEGHCGLCEAKRFCGGCRSNAFGLTGNYLESDPTCWKLFSNVTPIEGKKYYKKT